MQFLPEKLSKFNVKYKRTDATLHSDLLIECKIQHIVRKILWAVFAYHHSLIAPCNITQYHDQVTVALDFQIPSVLSVFSERIAIQSVQKKILINTEFYASRKRTIMAMCRMNG